MLNAKCHASNNDSIIAMPREFDRFHVPFSAQMVQNHNQNNCVTSNHLGPLRSAFKIESIFTRNEHKKTNARREKNTLVCDRSRSEAKCARLIAAAADLMQLNSDYEPLFDIGHVKIHCILFFLLLKYFVHFSGFFSKKKKRADHFDGSRALKRLNRIAFH